MAKGDCSAVDDVGNDLDERSVQAVGARRYLPACTFMRYMVSLSYRRTSGKGAECEPQRAGDQGGTSMQGSP